MTKQRCAWPAQDDQMIIYHDKEWGVPVHDDKVLFEYLILDAMQAGLSWKTILYKRKGFEKAFAGFEAQKVSQFQDTDVERLMQDTGIIRNRLKIRSNITNAHALIKIQGEFGSFDKYIWQFVGGQPIINNFKTDQDVPAVSKEAEQMSKDLKSRGFSFVGPTICYAFMQAAGMVNDHVTTCFRHRELLG